MPIAARAHKASPDRRADIMVAAREIFLKHGVDAARIEDICDLSGASVGSLYHHFGDKGRLASRVYLAALEKYLSELEQYLIPCGDAAHLIRGIVTYHLDWCRDNNGWARYLLNMRDVVSTQDEASLTALNKRYLKKIIKQVEIFAANGQIKSLPRYLYLPLVLGPLAELSRQYINGKQEHIPDHARDALIDVIWDGLKK